MTEREITERALGEFLVKVLLRVQKEEPQKWDAFVKNFKGGNKNDDTGRISRSRKN